MSPLELAVRCSICVSYSSQYFFYSYLKYFFLLFSANSGDLSELWADNSLQFAVLLVEEYPGAVIGTFLLFVPE